jgi:demethylmenaquinone methyltransferase/2-methoxy-6-polyprenyl-1,4-benzoquinol methylase
VDNGAIGLEGDPPGMDDYARSLWVSNPLRAPVMQAAVRALDLPPGSRGLDAGCGIGLQAALLAEAVGPAGHVTGLDTSPAFLEHARRLTHVSGLSGRVSFQAGDLNALPFEAGAFDWLWSADCAGYPAPEPGRLMRELARVVRPGGRVAILFWSSQALLPGYPALEARLNATRAGLAPFDAGMPPEAHPLRAPGWFRAAGLERAGAETFVRGVYAPLDGDLRAALTALLHMRWAGAEAELPESDAAAYRRLCRPESPDFIVNRPDYYAFFTYSLFHGWVAG